MREGQIPGFVALSVRAGAAIFVALITSLAVDNHFSEQFLRFFGQELLVRLVACATGTILAYFIWPERPGILAAVLSVFYVAWDSSGVLQIPAIDYDPYQYYIPFPVLKILWVFHLLIGAGIGVLFGGWFGGMLRQFMLGKETENIPLNKG